MKQELILNLKKSYFLTAYQWLQQQEEMRMLDWFFSFYTNLPT